MQAYLPDKDTDPELYELIKKYQTHSHSKTCRKYKNIACRLNFGQFFTDSTSEQVINCYHYPSSRYPGPLETLSREIFSSPKLDLHIVRVNDTSSFVIFAFSALHTILQHTTNSAAILMISIIVRNGKELTSKVLLRAPRWTWQMFIQKDKTKLIKFLKIATKIANLNAP